MADAPATRRPLHVLLVTTSLSRGGTQLSMVQLIDRLRPLGIRFTIVSVFPWQDELDAEVEALDVKVHKLSAGKLRTQVRDVRRIVEAERPDLVHTMIVAADIIGRAAAYRRAPALSSVVNTPWARARFDQPMPVRRRMLLHRTRLLDRWTARYLTAHIHAVSEGAKATAVRHFGVKPERVTVIERGRDEERLGRPSAERRARARDALGLAADAYVLVTVGRQEHQKGQCHLVDAVGLLPAGLPVTALLVGRPGKSSADIEARVARLRDPSRVQVLGHRTDVPEMLAAGDVFVLPSLYEGMSGAVIEAMALGLPVVATAIPGMDELVHEGVTGTLVPAGDPHALATAIERLFGDPAERARMGKAGRQLYEERFTLDRSVDRFAELYDRLGSPPHSSKR